MEMRELVSKLNAAAAAYYNGEEIMSNFEYDRLFDELTKMEEETGIVLPDSPTKNVGYKVVDSLPKVNHEFPALSLAKTKDIDEYVGKFKDILTTHSWINQSLATQDIVMEWKMDGSTVVATYDDGVLTQLATRGNGYVGSDITHNARYIKGLPTYVLYKGHFVVRGEAVMSYKEFERINSKLPQEEQYKNPRNLANSTISLLDSKEMAKREIIFHAFELVSKEEKFSKTTYCQVWDDLAWLDNMGFNTVKRSLVSIRFLKDYLTVMGERAKFYEFPVDGLVCCINDKWYSKTLPGTEHNPHIAAGYALKWKDEEEETVLRDIEWSASRTGLLNPVAVFDSVELEGTTVSRASVHNVSVVMGMDLKVGDSISVFKANKIIPQIAENKDKGNILKYEEYGTDKEIWADHNIPTKCPVCGGETQMIHSDNGSVVLVCSNPECAAKNIGKFTHFVERDCMNIVGLSEQTIEKLISAGCIKEYSDLFNLRKHPEIAEMEGFGEKSFEKMYQAADVASHTTFIPFLHSLGIPNVGKGQAKLLKKYLLSEYRKNHDIYNEGKEEGKETLFSALCHLLKENFDFTTIDGFGSVINNSLTQFFSKDIIDDVLYCTSETEIGRLLDNVEFEDEWEEEKEGESVKNLSGLTFVITGSLTHFNNREELKAKIEEKGGKVAGSVSKSTSYLINNDIESTSGKNKKAKELGIKIISEEDFLKMV